MSIRVTIDDKSCPCGQKRTHSHDWIEYQQLLEQVKYQTKVVAADPSMPLGEWKSWIEKLIVAHGEGSRMMTDAGHNNVEMVIQKETRP